MKRRSIGALLSTGIGLTLAVGAISLAFPVQASAARARYESKKPLYMKVDLTKDRSRVLCVVFDESNGTGTGYDELYADVDFNGRFEEAEKLRAKIVRSSLGTNCAFPPIKLDVPFDNKNKALRVSYPCEVTFGYQRLSYQFTRSLRTTSGGIAVRARGAASARTTTREAFSISAGIRLQEDSAEWQYYVRGSIMPSESFEMASLWSFLQIPKVTIDTRPDAKNAGSLGIALKLVANELPLECRKGTATPKAHVEIKRPDGRVVHRDDAPLDKFLFG